MRHILVLLLSVSLSAQTLVPPAPPLQRKPLLAIVQGPGPGFGGGSSYKYADFNADGLLDVVSSGSAGGPTSGLFFWAGRGNGQLAPYVFFPTTTGVGFCDVADIDGDGDLDAVIAGQPAQVLLNDGRAVFTDGTSAAFPGGPPTGGISSYIVRFVDLNGDGHSDLFIGPLPMRAFFNDGHGHFVEDLTAMPVVTQNTTDIVFADFDGDGDLDFVTCNGGYLGYEPNHIFWNDGRGHFPAYAVLPALLFGAFRVAAADFDGDGRTDIVFCALRSQSVLLHNEGAGRFTDISNRLSQNPVPNLGADSIVVGDIDQDGDIDIVRSDGSLLLIDVNRGDGTFEPKSPELFSGRETLHFIAQDGLSLVDLDQDGDLDLWIGQGGLSEIYWGAVTHLRTTTYAALGTTTPLQMFGFEGLAVLAMSATVLTTPVSTPLGYLWINPATTVVDPSPIVVARDGIGNRLLQVPNSPALRNRTIYLQALHLAPSRPWLRLTNLSRLTFY